MPHSKLAIKENSRSTLQRHAGAPTYLPTTTFRARTGDVGVRSPPPRSGLPAPPSVSTGPTRRCWGLPRSRVKARAVPSSPERGDREEQGQNARRSVSPARRASPRNRHPSQPRRGLHPTTAAAPGALRNWGGGEWGASPPQLLLGSHPTPRAASANIAAPAPPGRPPRGAQRALGGAPLPATPRLAPRSPAEGYRATAGPGVSHEALSPAPRRGRALPAVPSRAAASPGHPANFPRPQTAEGRGLFNGSTLQPGGFLPRRGSRLMTAPLCRSPRRVAPCPAAARRPPRSSLTSRRSPARCCWRP